MYTISSNQLSTDLQAVQAVEWLRLNHAEAYSKVRNDFPEWPIFSETPLVLSGVRFDTEAMDVDPEYGSWLVDAIENTGLVLWIDGEPFALEEGDDLEAMG